MKYFGRRFFTVLALCGLSLTTMAQNVQQDLRELKEWKAGSEVHVKAVEQYGIDKCFVSEKISDGVMARMKNHSYPSHCTISRNDLRYIRVLHYDGEGKVRIGELVCNKMIAADLLAIFRELYRQRYAIQQMRLIDDYDADDERSMRANNTSSFCYRVVKGSKKLSYHAQGRAIDINPLYNPCYKVRNGKAVVQPSNALRYCDRKAYFAYKIDRQDLLYKLFIQHGFRWGGAWKHSKDYQHFEK